MKNKTIEQIKKHGLTFNFLALPSDYFKIEIINKMGSDIERMYPKTVYGISHFIEHLAFKSPKDFSTKELLNLLKAKGTYNASTDFDRINYWFKSTSENADLAIKICTNIAYNDLSNITEDEFLTERNVVKNEVKRYQDDDQNMFWFNSNPIFRGNDIRDNILGTPEIVQTFELTDCQKIKNFFLNYGETVINVTFNPEHLTEDEIIEKIYAEIGKHDIEPSKIKNEYNKYLTKPETIKKYIENPSEQVLTILHIDNVKDVLIANTANSFLSRFSKYSMNELIREQNGLTYGIHFGTQRINDKNYTYFGCDVTKGTEDKMMGLFKESIEKSKDFTEKEYNEFQNSNRLKKNMSLINMENYGTWLSTATWEPVIFDKFRGYLNENIDIANEKMNEYCSYEKIKGYIQELNDLIKTGTYGMICNLKGFKK